LKSKQHACRSREAGNGYRAVIESFEPKRDSLIPMLHALQSALGYLPEAAMEDVADYLDMPVSEVYGAATFYTLFSTEPKGRCIVRLCDSPPCHIEGSNGIKAAIERELGIRPGQTTEDGSFTFELVSCFGLCGVAPAVMINEDVYGNLRPEMIHDILARYRRKES